jgi:pSer/pThr/pTyr-binding forkhead associated (FHA) protein
MPCLITVSGTRVPLRPGQSYVLGRGRDCDVVVDDIACSRRHALVTLGESEDSGYVEDLGSRNGSFHNGEPVLLRTPIRQASRIRIGKTVFLVQLFEEPYESDLSETGTLGMESRQLGAHVDGGELSSYGLLELLRLLTHSKRDLSLHVALTDDNAQVEFRQGEVVAAAHGGLQGFNALVRLGREKTGIFWIVENTEECDRNVDVPSTHLTEELARCLVAKPSND